MHNGLNLICVFGFLMYIKNCLWIDNKKLSVWPPKEIVEENLHPQLRRRLTPLGQKSLIAMTSMIATLEDTSIPWIVSSRHGDASRRVHLLDLLIKDEYLSPTEFSMSVHNAIIAMHSIFSNNKETHYALAGGEDTFQMGFLESIAFLSEKGGTVGYLFYDYSQINDILENSKRSPDIDCLAIILSKEKGEVSLSYRNAKNNKIPNFCFKSLINFFENGDLICKIPVNGGEINIERLIT